MPVSGDNPLFGPGHDDMFPPQSTVKKKKNPVVLDVSSR